ncbi:vitamin K epoxide reductase family protein [Microbacterium sp. P05]|uniref:vitamin K epoxide reductase family protein n=1 Tax=Microbacterium sp. P05 TaxID=3366948 RepID=UPI003744DA1C
MSTPSRSPRPTALAVWLVIAGVVGWWAAFSLLTERIHLLEDPGASASCDFSLLIQCGANLRSWQGSLLGFPNPVIGLAAWIAPIVVGVALLAGARFARWFWWLFALGTAGAFGFVVWLIGQSIFVLGTLCPWCMVTWVVTIPTFYAVVLHVLRTGIVPVGAGVRRAAEALMGWLPLLAVGSYVVIAVIAQLRLDVIGSLG